MFPCSISWMICHGFSRMTLIHLDTTKSRMATQKQWHVNCDIQKAHMTNGPLVFSKKKKDNMPHMQECLRICGTFVGFLSVGTFLMFNLAILVTIGAVILTAINSWSRYICCFFYQTLILQMRKKVLCLVIHAGRWYWSCQYPARWWHHSSMLANHGHRQWTFKNSMSYHLLRGMSSFFTSAHPCHIMLYSLVC